MRVFGCNRPHGAWALPVLLLLPPGGGLQGQLRAVISNEIAVSGSEAALRLDFQDQSGISITFRGGEVLVDGEVVGSYTRGDPLDAAWRGLLGDVLALDDGPLARALVDWTPPESLTGAHLEVAELLDQAMEEGLALPEGARDPGPSTESSVAQPGEGTLLRALLGRAGALEGLALALEGVSLDPTSIHIDENVEIGPGEVVDGSLILVGGDLDLRGMVEGDVVVAGGTVHLREGSLVTGNLRVADGSIHREGGSVEGSIAEVGKEESVAVGPRELEELRKDLEREIRREVSRERSQAPGLFWSPLRHLGRSIAGLLENLATFLVLSILGVLAVHFGRDRLEIVALTVRKAPARSALVGLAGGFLLIPAWILGMVALAVSIIGIPVLLAWIPLFPIAAGLAALLGYLAVARNVGEWVAEQEYRGLEWIRGSNAFYAVIAGVGAFLVPCVAANVAQFLGLGFFQGLLAFVGSAVSFLAAAMGLGAVLLTRGGRIRPYEAYFEVEEDFWGDEEPREPPRPPSWTHDRAGGSGTPSGEAEGTKNTKSEDEKPDE